MAKGTAGRVPPTEVSDEASAKGLELAREQGDAYERALRHMVEEVAHGDETRVGDYVVAYAVEEAEGMYRLEDGSFEWVEPEEENAHVEVSVRDGADGRFVPGLKVTLTVVDEDGREVGTHEQPFLWHPWLHHYGRNWKLPGSGTYDLKVRIEPPTFMRHDRKNGRRYAEPVEVEFRRVRIDVGRERS